MTLSTYLFLSNPLKNVCRTEWVRTQGNIRYLDMRILLELLFIRLIFIKIYFIVSCEMTEMTVFPSFSQQKETLVFKIFDNTDNCKM